MHNTNRFAAVILAAGASTRMGQNKLLLDVDGVPMIRRAVQRAHDAGFTPIVVVLGNEPDRVRASLHDLPCTFALNTDFTGPTSGSLHAGLNALGADTDGALLMLADMVHVTTHMLRTLSVAANADTAPLHVSRYGDVLAPPLLFRRVLWNELLAWQGEGCGKAVVKAHQHEAQMHDWPLEALQDIDTPAEYRALTERPTDAD